MGVHRYVRLGFLCTWCFLPFSGLFSYATPTAAVAATLQEIWTDIVPNKNKEAFAILVPEIVRESFHEIIVAPPLVKRKFISSDKMREIFFRKGVIGGPEYVEIIPCGAIGGYASATYNISFATGTRLVRFHSIFYVAEEDGDYKVSFWECNKSSKFE